LEEFAWHEDCSVERMLHEKVVTIGVAMQPALSSVVTAFNWECQRASSFDDLGRLALGGDIAAVVVDPSAIQMSWKEALTRAENAAPDSRILLCERFSFGIDWAEASSAGAFHILRLPLDAGELRQSLGFVWAAKNKKLHVIPADPAERSRLRKSAAAAGGSASQVA